MNMHTDQLQVGEFVAAVARSKLWKRSCRGLGWGAVGRWGPHSFCSSRWIS
ncbi:hypothetical protein DB30_07276 [Enhygromyxa salina]|uniref:Uncharacterized protein n=1 Tax=Enhygromyxa salina TaxID=215803 RepID=A0A0C1Z905_9BACT|nr:hypothetical protein DB30_07276 [Enhygromyxa salina]